jgi:GTP pyrophosphokinase
MIAMSINNQPFLQDTLAKTVTRLLDTIKQYMSAAEIEQVTQALQLAQESSGGVHDHREASLQTLRLISPLEHALAVATILAEMHIDAVGVAAGVVFEAVAADLLAFEQVESVLGSPVGRVVGSMLRLNILERKKQASAHFAAVPGGDVDSSRDQKKRRIRERYAHIVATNTPVLWSTH